MAVKKTGGDAPKRPSVVFSFLGEAAEFATGVIAGQMFSSVLRAGAAEAFKALKGKLFGQLFTGIKVPDKAPDGTDIADSAGIETAKEKLKGLLKDASGDEKLAGIAEDYVTAVVAIQLSSRPDKTEAINNEKTKYKAAVNEYLLGKSKQSLQNFMAELSDLDTRGGRVTPAGRPVSYRRDFMQWLHRDHADPARYCAGQTPQDHFCAHHHGHAGLHDQAVERFDYLTFALGEPSLTEQGGELFDAALNGRLEQHPTVQKLETWSSSNAADRQELAEMEARCFANRRKV